jgi:hypothetical protein
MPVVSYYSTTFDPASEQEAVDTTSSQIFLSRDVAANPAALPEGDSSPPVASIFGSSSKHSMNPAEPSRLPTVDVSYRALSVADETRKLP